MSPAADDSQSVCQTFAREMLFSFHYLSLLFMQNNSESNEATVFIFRIHTYYV
jgi:hypothetical protein